MNTTEGWCTDKHYSTLAELGWTAEHAAAFDRYNGDYVAGRISCRQKTSWEVLVEGEMVTTGISGAMKRLGRHPAVGDFVVLLRQPACGTTMIVDILPQRTRFTRGAAGREGSNQVIAANVDTVFIVTAAGRDLNPRRTERYLAIAHASGAHPVIVINKCDLADDPTVLADAILAVAGSTPVITISAATGEGLERLLPFLEPGSTIVLIGSSGVGKSTLINRLLDQSVQKTSETRVHDQRGRHTTTVRQLIVLNGGALMIDTPGLREVGIGTASEGIDEAFPDILMLAEGCRFSDCRHEQEPGCAVQQAVRDGVLTTSRFNNYHRLVKELAFEKAKAEIGLARMEKKRWKQISGHGKLVNSVRAARDL